jgi:hypothetical protein
MLGTSATAILSQRPFPPDQHPPAPVPFLLRQQAGRNNFQKVLYVGGVVGQFVVVVFNKSVFEKSSTV